MSLSSSSASPSIAGYGLKIPCVYHLYGTTPYIDKIELVDSLTLLHWPCLIAIMYVYLHLHALGSVDLAIFEEAVSWVWVSVI